MRIADLPPADRVEMAFAGRSNVGKSSLINALTGRRPGAHLEHAGPDAGTQIFEAERRAAAHRRHARLRLCRRRRSDKVAAWTKLIHHYLTGRPNLRRVYVLVDGRHGPKANDLTVMNELDKAAVSYQVVLTKADKPLGSELERRDRGNQGGHRQAPGRASRPDRHLVARPSSASRSFGPRSQRLLEH